MTNSDHSIAEQVLAVVEGQLALPEAERLSRDAAVERVQAIIAENEPYPTEAQLDYFVQALQQQRSAHDLEIRGWRKRWRDWGEGQKARAERAEAALAKIAHDYGSEIAKEALRAP